MTLAANISRSSEAGELRRESILRAADELLAEKGLDGLTIRAVLAQTGLARRAFYDLFATKDDLVLAVFEHTLADAAERLEKAGLKLDGPNERLRLIINSIVVARTDEKGRDPQQRDRRSAAFSLEHLRLAQARPSELQNAIQPLVDLIRDIISDGVAQDLFVSPDPERSARFVYNLVSTTVHTELLDPKSRRLAPTKRVKLAEQLSDFCLRALSA